MFTAEDMTMYRGLAEIDRRLKHNEPVCKDDLQVAFEFLYPRWNTSRLEHQYVASVYAKQYPQYLDVSDEGVLVWNIHSGFKQILKSDYVGKSIILGSQRITQFNGTLFITDYQKAWDEKAGFKAVIAVTITPQNKHFGVVIKSGAVVAPIRENTNEKVKGLRSALFASGAVSVHNDKSLTFYDDLYIKNLSLQDLNFLLCGKSAISPTVLNLVQMAYVPVDSTFPSDIVSSEIVRTEDEDKSIFNT